MSYDPNRHHRHSIRLKGYDYSQAGAYFVTIVTRNRECLFGEVVDGEMRLDAVGQIVAESWQWLAAQYDYVTLDAWVVMPNHLHGIIVITDGAGGGRGDDGGRVGLRTAPTAPAKRKTVGRLVGAFKTVSTKRINEQRGAPGAQVWQRNYYEHIIRDQASLNRIREYIQNNPAQWTLDRENPRSHPSPAEAA